MNKIKALGATISIALLIVVTLALAFQLNWYKAGNLNGTLQESGVTISKANLNLGTLNSGSFFEITDNLTVNIPSNEKGGLNITTIFVLIPGGWEYLVNRFATLAFNFSVNSMEHNFVVYRNPARYVNYYDGDGEYNWWGKYVDNIFLSSGLYTIPLTAYGITNSPNTTLTIDLGFGIELT